MSITDTTAAPQQAETGLPQVDADWGPDPLDGIPAELIGRHGAMDHDTAGGCG